MESRFQIGTKVQWIDEALSGIISKIEGQRAEVILEDGFTEWVSLSKLTSFSDNMELDFNHNQEKHIEYIVEQRSLKIEEIDLHIENLTVNWKSISQDKILDWQLSSFRDELVNCKRNNTDRLIVIHGKGKGILKYKIIDLINNEYKLTYREMNEGKYKNAALEIEIR